VIFTNYNKIMRSTQLLIVLLATSAFAINFNKPSFLQSSKDMDTTRKEASGSGELAEQGKMFGKFVVDEDGLFHAELHGKVGGADADDMDFDDFAEEFGAKEDGEHPTAEEFF
jgi:hypothetical protein